MNRVAKVRVSGFLSLLLLAGCSTQHYEVTMTPKGDGVERTLIVSQSVNDSSKRIPAANGEVDLLAAAFGQEVPSLLDGRHSFRGLFFRNMPADVGGHGTYWRFHSPCGSATGYVERFRGDDDLVGELDARRKAVGELIDLADRWAEQELGESPVFPSIRKALQTTIRRDLENLSCLIYLSTMSEKKGDDIDRDVGARVIQYLLERGYVTLADLPIVMRALADFHESRGEDQIVTFGQDFAIRLFGLDDNETTRNALTIFTDEEHLGQSLMQFLKTTPEYIALQHLVVETGEAADTDPFDVLEVLIYRALLPKSVYGSDRLILRLKTIQPPFGTNGVWNPESSSVIWDLGIEPRQTFAGREIPRICYAVWTEPKIEYQKSHFGKVVFTDQELLTFCLWYRGLTADETVEWNVFTESLQPGELLDEQLKSFRFRAERTSIEGENSDQESHAKTMIELIRKSIRK